MNTNIINGLISSINLNSKQSVKLFKFNRVYNFFSFFSFKTTDFSFIFTYIYIFAFTFTFVISSFYLCTPFSYGQTHHNSNNIDSSNNDGTGRDIKKQNNKKQKPDQAVIKSDQAPDISDSKKAIIENNKTIKTEKGKSEAKKNGKKINETEKKKLKKAAYILESIISGLMNILVGSFICVIGLIILKWFFLERRVDK